MCIDCLFLVDDTELKGQEFPMLRKARVDTDKKIINSLSLSLSLSERTNAHELPYSV
jgi:hypothetical protein